MNLFSVLLALLLEQLKPLQRGTAVHAALTSWLRWAAHTFDAGRERHAWVVWLITVVLPAVLVWLVYAGVAHYSLLLGLAWNVSVLYLTLGFRQFSHYFTDIRDALDRDDEFTARSLLTEWRHLDVSELPRTELMRHVIEHSLLAAHRHVFGVLFWFVVLSSLGLGPAGAILYRTAEFASRYWAYRSETVGEPTNERLLGLSQRLFGMMDHFPARLTAFGFAVVGNFEEAINCWRRDAELWRHPNEGVILAAAAGAVGVQLGGRAAPGVTPDRSKTFTRGAGVDDLAADGSTPGAPAVSGHLQSVVGLVWRSVVLWMLLLALLTLANLIG
jgi:adenosylcobinamide-phosphate synthase